MAEKGSDRKYEFIRCPKCGRLGNIKLYEAKSTVTLLLQGLDAKGVVWFKEFLPRYEKLLVEATCSCGQVWTMNDISLRDIPGFLDPRVKHITER